MPHGVLMLQGVPSDPSREEEWNRWYTHTHIPDLSKAKGFVRARRYRNLTPGASNKYMIVYEFDSPDIQESYDSLLRQALNAYKAGRHIECIGRPPLKPGETPVPGGNLWQELDPSEFKPLEKHDYSRTALDAMFKPIEAALLAKGR